MSFQIIEIVEARPDGLAAKVRHQDHLIQAVLPDKRKEDFIIGVPFRQELLLTES